MTLLPITREHFENFEYVEDFEIFEIVQDFDKFEHGKMETFNSWEASITSDKLRTNGDNGEEINKP